MYSRTSKNAFTKNSFKKCLNLFQQMFRQLQFCILPKDLRLYSTWHNINQTKRKKYVFQNSIFIKFRFKFETWILRIYDACMRDSKRQEIVEFFEVFLPFFVAQQIIKFKNISGAFINCVMNLEKIN